jgi:hypothetical protein
MQRNINERAVEEIGIRVKLHKEARSLPVFWRW